MKVLVDLTAPVRRRDYLTTGLILALVKYAGDVVIFWFLAHWFWTPMHYVQSVWSLLTSAQGGHQGLVFALALWTLPFIWVGFTLSVRRAKNAGLSELTAIWFFVPFANYLMMAALCLSPDDRQARVADGEPSSTTERTQSRLVAATLGISAGLAIALVMVGVSVLFLRTYGVALFFLTPFAMGAVTTAVFNARFRSTASETIGVTLALFGFTAAAMTMLAIEGLVCLLMALPLAIGLGLVGALFARGSLRDRPQSLGLVSLLLFLLPVSAFVEPARGPVLHEVRSSVDVDASPTDVWQLVVAFPALPQPTDWIFTSGIAYPTQARIEGAGVGAIRYCEFSTGAFVEPITAWEPGVRLAFDVIASPPPLREWSPYRQLAPPHLDGYLQSRRGEFRLIALPDGRTRLEGSTWYELKVGPDAYWRMFSDALIRRIHLRVLNHVKVLAEASRGD